MNISIQSDTENWWKIIASFENFLLYNFTCVEKCLQQPPLFSLYFTLRLFLNVYITYTKIILPDDYTTITENMV